MNNKYKHWRLETDNNGIIWCHFDKQDSSTNVLSANVLEEFESIVTGVENNVPKGLIIVSDKTNGFIAGADVEEFTKIEGRDQALQIIKKVHDLFNRLEKLSCPTLSLINGFCLGGGLELSLACDYRVALDDAKTRIGFPEVLLGIFPGFGGTARSIRRAGAIEAIQLMLTGRTVDARKAKKLGLVDRAVPERQLQNAARGLILKKPRPYRPGLLKRIAAYSFVRPLLAKFFRRQLGKRVRQEQYPAPYALIDLWEKYGGNEKAMLEAETEAVAELITSDTSRNLVRAFLLQEQLKATGKDETFTARHVHVIGAGVMGGDIAAWCVFKGYSVTLQDRAPEYIAPAIKRAYKLFKRRLKVPHRVTAAMDRLVPDLAGHGIDKADVIIEAIIENTEAKVELFKELESRVSETTILATNTSSIPLDDISRHLEKPERLVGIHFFNPVARMQLVEIVYAGNTGQNWIDRASTFCRKIDRLPLQVKSSPGFLVNRILTPYLLEAVALLEEGVSAAVIDDTAEKFGMPMGPIELADTVGLDICLTVAENMAGKIEISIPDELRKMVAAGKLGRKTDQGFYKYKNGKPAKDTAGTSQIPEDMEDRLILRILNECVACLREKIVSDHEALDAGMIFGTGFAPFRGGPMFYARQRGYQAIVDRLTGLQQAHGNRFAPDDGWDAILGGNA